MVIAKIRFPVDKRYFAIEFRLIDHISYIRHLRHFSIKGLTTKSPRFETDCKSKKLGKRLIIFDFR